jgi:purine nucleosidase
MPSVNSVVGVDVFRLVVPPVGPAGKVRAAMRDAPIKVHLDTDVGDDLDDAFCLALLLRSPEVRVSGITTVFNDTRDRAAMTQVMCDAAGLAGADVPIVAGMGGVLSTRPLEWAVTRKPLYRADHAVFAGVGPEGLVSAFARARRDADAILAIGPLTNVAASLVADPDARAFPKAIFMCGEFQQFGLAEYNVRVDVEAAARVFDAGFPIDVIPWKIGVMTQLQEPERQLIRDVPTPLGRVLADYMRQFHRHEPHRADMFDPMTVVALLRPELFRWERGTIKVEVRAEHAYGLTLFHADPQGPHRWASDVDVVEAKRFLLERLCADVVHAPARSAKPVVERSPSTESPRHAIR